MNIQDKLKAHGVKRWNIVNTTHQQTLAEHLFNVAMIAEEIARILNDGHIQGLSPLVVYALKHDLAEVILGDVPTPTKQRMQEKGFNYRALEWGIMEDEYPMGMNKLPEETKIIIKIADQMEALWFIQTYGVDRHAQVVELDMQDKMEKYMYSLPSNLRLSAQKVWGQMINGDIII
jgi:5'-deoxynucleotidase YfbR-like HD superfamily hydrolase|tara:strand:+ start:1697 stop:2224 length:528 start_codon:yes stop_codon:yes gene_type:complete